MASARGPRASDHFAAVVQRRRYRARTRRGTCVPSVASEKGLARTKFFSAWMTCATGHGVEIDALRKLVPRRVLEVELDGVALPNADEWAGDVAAEPKALYVATSFGAHR